MTKTLDQRIAEASAKYWKQFIDKDRWNVHGDFKAGANFMREELEREIKVTKWFDKHKYEIKDALLNKGRYWSISEWPEPSSEARGPEEKE